jgi:hypothetical protein
MQPFVTEKVAGMFFIQRGGDNQEHDAEWLDPDHKWQKSIFDAAGFKVRKHAIQVLRELENV